MEILSKMQELRFFQLKTHRLSPWFHQKTQKQKNKKKHRQKNCKKTVFTSLVLKSPVKIFVHILALWFTLRLVKRSGHYDPMLSTSKVLRPNNYTIEIKHFVHFNIPNICW